MIVELASLPLAVQTYIQNEQKVQLVVQGEQVYLTPLHQFASKLKTSGLLAHLNIHTDDDFWFEPISEEELAWWNGDKTDKYGISL
ncbi:hypothetical protein LP090_04235 [Moraxella bovis]|uniref:hypothetical protein n=1 Tax=Moraxella bovis TaxID=476 RepID=UPI0022263FE2|nr:hypothetical protein [Moraxella bovis]UYZ67792.1 hypothetical protein LP122_08365 [Moraxella bovis]UYZ70164.1 hypothetical protein LP089_08450 [Moraxella bovis]UYZ73924.1 hypothetical protein LP105_04260 [Moraxella bovis]UZA13455.1 hypothetical protein LP102_08465 [Moraxella bovis]UZA28190.1 hypothetical protein LP119_04300 [Moraxella bovis]